MCSSSNARYAFWLVVLLVSMAAVSFLLALAFAEIAFLFTYKIIHLLPLTNYSGLVQTHSRITPTI